MVGLVLGKLKKGEQAGHDMAGGTPARASTPQEEGMRRLNIGRTMETQGARTTSRARPESCARKPVTGEETAMAAGVGTDVGKLTMPGLISSVIPIRMGFPGDGADAMVSGGGWT